MTYSRAGYGGSSRKAGRSVADVVADMEALLDPLGAERCVTAGWSGGGPHALAMGALLPQRTAGVLSIAGVAPYGAEGIDFMAGMGEQNVVEFNAALAGEETLRPSLEADAEQLADTDAAGVIEGMATLLPQVDRDHLTDEFGEDLAANFKEGLRNGVDGWVDDDLAFTRSVGLRPRRDHGAGGDLAGQRGPDGALRARPVVGRRRCPACGRTCSTGEGHLSVAVGALDEMFAELRATL